MNNYYESSTKQPKSIKGIVTVIIILIVMAYWLVYIPLAPKISEYFAEKRTKEITALLERTAVWDIKSSSLVTSGALEVDGTITLGGSSTEAITIDLVEIEEKQ